jgi:Family of unknown function (DUF5317)
MAYAVVAIVLGASAGLLAGGRFSNLGEHRLSAWPLLPAGVLLQVASNFPRGTVALLLLLASYAALAAFAAANVKLFGMALVVVGLACNLLVIAVNHGMPVRPSAVIRAGIAANDDDLRHIHLQAKHHYERPSDRLLGLADILPVAPLREVLSVGDVVMSVGIAMVVASLLRKEPSHPQSHPTDSIPSER